MTASASVLAGCTQVPGILVPAIEPQPCPPIDHSGGRSICSHTDTDGGIDVQVSGSEFSTDRESLEALSLRFTNGTDTELRFRTSNWELHRHDGLGWNEREVDVGPDGAETVDPGDEFGWFGIDAIFERGATNSTPEGLYAAILPISVGSERIVCVFLFRVTPE